MEVVLGLFRDVAEKGPQDVIVVELAVHPSRSTIPLPPLGVLSHRDVDAQPSPRRGAIA